MSAAVLQALALQEDLSGVKELRDKDPKSFRTTERLVVWLRAAVKERVNAERKAAGEDEKAHVYASHARPEWWPEGWDWSSRALEAANRLQLEAFFLPMRDWKASHQEREVRAAVARKRGQHRPARGEDTAGAESEDASAAERHFFCKAQGSARTRSSRRG
ncbi:hypothetical protein WJX75_009507 [Coccomyxa subellipsoidea]|uniref:Uncharacterized protein n=1 Tax=Coccomyxa subellipsoidea TaxID=248742 RepID=A0ABR2YWU1_9CHLO